MDDTDNAGASDRTAERVGSVDPAQRSDEAKFRDPLVILDEMLDSIDLILRYTQGLSYEEFSAQQVLQDAVVLRIAILGEAASHLPDQDKARWTNVPWRVVTDMRNRLIHGYFAMRLDLVWQVVAVDLPLLKSQLRSIRNSLS
jgi:uncharacterized protein with HEPN domain